MKYLFIIGLFLCCAVSGSYDAQADHPLFPAKAAVVSSHPLATKAGEDILARGGNAFDAAVAVSAMLAVVEPFGSGLGGGGFWLIYDAKTNSYNMLDAREMAPQAATADMYLDHHGNPVPGLSTEGPLSAGIPGLPAALANIAENYGSLELGALLQSAIRAAQDGFAVDRRYITGAEYKLDLLRQNPEAAGIFLDNNALPAPGWVLKQPDLAKTLTLIAQNGAAGFYEGELAERLVKDIAKHGGIWTLEDLKAYHVVNRTPVTGTYKGTKIIAAALPSSGGITLINSLNILSNFNLATQDAVTQKHLIIEALRRAYHERAEYLGDSDFVEVPTERLLSAEHATAQSRSINLAQATKSDTLSLDAPAQNKGTETTHFAVIDREGNRVAVTQSINFWFGAGFVPKGTGVLLNNQMDDFVIKPGVENGYQLIGTKANAVAPGKRMLSSMTPTFLESDQGVAILGTPGGSRIISMVLLAALDRMQGTDGKTIVARPRFHHQFQPDEVFYESGAFSDEEIRTLKRKGHHLTPVIRRYGNMQIILWDYKDNTVKTFSDPRGKGDEHVY
ncbi:MAG: gamma-glutamyltransferase [Pseudomonadota bacterium]|nr:gamma-glutamyltransferase [Pseudomonadota bacterium]QKK04694.1 MAG: gamma-glutamyltransferase [Pseudomonadota bacterium]